MSVRLDRDRVIRLGAVSAAFALGFVILWQLLARLLYTDRGLDLTDEGLYLLAADPPSSTAAWVVPFGWHTKWLFSLVGHDIADFRTAAAVIIVVLGAWAGLVIARSPRPPTDNSKSETVIVGLGCAVGGTGSLLLFAGLLRTPGYNWVNLVGILVAILGAVMLTRGTIEQIGWRSLRSHVVAATTSFGALFAFAAKPTSGLLIVLGVVMLTVIAIGLRSAARLAVLMAAWLSLWLLAAVATRAWPIDFLTTFHRTIDFPVPTEAQTLRFAIRDTLRLPTTALHELNALPSVIRALLLCTVGLAAVCAYMADRLSPWVRCIPLVVSAAVATAVATGSLGTSPVRGRFAWPGTTLWITLLVAGAALHLLSNTPTRGAGNARQLFGTAFFVLAMSVAFGFGSSHGVFRQIGLGGVLPILIALTLVAFARDRGRLIGSAVVAVVTVIGVGATLGDSYETPYRLDPIISLNTALPIGSGSLRVDQATARTLSELGRLAVTAGWCHGTPLLGVVWRWSSTVPFFLDARAPESLMVTLFGYEGSLDVAGYSLRLLDPAEWSNAWVLASAPSELPPGAEEAVDEVVSLLPGTIGATFPDDYTLVASVSDLQLWRPAELLTQPCSARSAINASPNATP